MPISTLHVEHENLCFWTVPCPIPVLVVVMVPQETHFSRRRSIMVHSTADTYLDHCILPVSNSSHLSAARSPGLLKKILTNRSGSGNGREINALHNYSGLDGLFSPFMPSENQGSFNKASRSVVRTNSGAFQTYSAAFTMPSTGRLFR